MHVRRIALAAASALLAAAVVTQSANATDDVDADVGGGAAAVQVIGAVSSRTLSGLVGAERISYANSTPVVVLGPDGGASRRQIVDQRVGKVARVQGGSVSIIGNRRGTPFAQATTVLTGVTVQGTSIAGITTSCLWDRNNDGVGTTTIVNADGTSYSPEPNTVLDLVGIGSLTLNEQFFDTWPVYNAARGGYYDAQVINVYGAHLRLLPALADLYGMTDVILGFTSCDPVKLPNISGLKLSGGAHTTA